MAIVAYTGLPGSGKSYGVVQNVIVPALQKGKRVFTNIPFNEEKLAAKCGLLPVFFKVDDIRENPDWFQQVFQSGGVLVLDEVWRLWPSGLKTHMILEQHKSFLAEHRHMVGEDGYSTEVYLVTQDLSQIAAFARNLVDTTFRASKLSAIGANNRFRVDIYDGPVTGPKPPKDKRIRDTYGKYEPDIYALYKSHTMSDTGAAGDETLTDTRKNLFGGWIVKAGLAAVVIGVIVATWGAIRTKSFYETGGDEVKKLNSNVPPQQAPQMSAPREKSLLDDHEIRIIFNLAGNGETQFVYRISKGSIYSTVGDYELKLLKYDVQIVNQCLVIIRGYGKTYYAQCYREPQKEGLNLVSSTQGIVQGG